MKEMTRAEIVSHGGKGLKSAVYGELRKPGVKGAVLLEEELPGGNRIKLVSFFGDLPLPCQTPEAAVAYGSRKATGIGYFQK